MRRIGHRVGERGEPIGELHETTLYETVLNILQALIGQTYVTYPICSVNSFRIVGPSSMSKPLCPRLGSKYHLEIDAAARQENSMELAKETETNIKARDVMKSDRRVDKIVA